MKEQQSDKDTLHQLSNLFSPQSQQNGQTHKALVQMGGYDGISKLLRVNFDEGLTEDTDDTRWRSQKFGQHSFKLNKSKNRFHGTFMQIIFDDIVITILFITTVISIIFGSKFDYSIKQSVTVLILLFLTTIILSFQQHIKLNKFESTQNILEALTKRVVVRRKGEVKQIGYEQILVGDIISLTPGSQLPAHGIVLKSNDLKVDQSSITGENELVRKQKFDANLPGNQSNKYLMLAGSYASQGDGQMIVLAVGTNCINHHLLHINTSMNRMEQTDLQIAITETSIKVGYLGLYAAFLFFIIMIVQLIWGYFSQQMQFKISFFAYSLLKSIQSAAVILLIGVPDMINAAPTLYIANSMKKLLLNNILVRKIDVVEKSGKITDICTDKTGILTQNRMQVTLLWASQCNIQNVNHKSHEKLSEYIQNALLQQICIGICLNTSAIPNFNGYGFQQIGNKSECAMIEFAYKMGYKFEEIRKKFKIIHTLPFSSQRKMKSIIYQNQNQQYKMFTIGASQKLLSLSTNYLNQKGQIKQLSQEMKQQINEVCTDYAKKSMRTVMLCGKKIKKQQTSGQAQLEQLQQLQLQSNLIFVCMFGIEDPLRVEIPNSILQFGRSGITARMITGDNLTTAISVARKCNILPSNQNADYSADSQSAMEGRTFRQNIQILGYNNRTKIQQLNPQNISKLTDLLNKIKVLARATPQDKYMFVKGLKETGKVVAVTGDGTSDAPALKVADVGISCGIQGTEIAKQASSVILLDDNYNTIKYLVLYGRNIYSYINNLISLSIITNAVAILIILFTKLASNGSIVITVFQMWVCFVLNIAFAWTLLGVPISMRLLQKKSNTQMFNSHDSNRIILSVICQSIVLLIVFLLFPIQQPTKISSIMQCFILMQVFNFIQYVCQFKQEENSWILKLTQNSGPIINLIGILSMHQIFLQVLHIFKFNESYSVTKLALTEHFLCVLASGAYFVLYHFINVMLNKKLKIQSSRVTASQVEQQSLKKGN